MDDAIVWVVDGDVLAIYKDYCNNDPDHRAESPGFVQTCIEDEVFVDEVEQNREKKPMRGRYPGGCVPFSSFIPTLRAV